MASGAAIAGAVIAGLGLANSVYEGRKNEKAQNAMQEEAKRSNAARLKKQEEEMNRMNQKKPDISKFKASNAMATNPTTLLTSSAGDQSLGKTTMLGGS